MAKQSTTVRLDEKLRKQVMREARRTGLNFSGLLHLLLGAYAHGEIQIGVTQYPQGYLEALAKEAGELRRLQRAGKTKRYGSSGELFDELSKS